MSHETIRLSLTINGERVAREDVRADMLLIDFLHEELGLTGTKLSCGIGACGSCKVALQEAEGGPMLPVLACFARLKSIDGMHVTTVEGLAQGGEPNALQTAFLAHHAFQCGWSTPGFLMAATVLIDQLKRSPAPRAQLDSLVLEAIGGNVCRCTGYLRYFAAIKEVILATPGLVQAGAIDPVATLPPAVTFALTKRSQNDLADKLLVGRFDAPSGEITFASNLELGGCRASLSVAVASLHTGEPVRDLNLRRFFFVSETLDFELTRAKLIDRRTSLETAPWGTPVPVLLTGKLQAGAMRRSVSHEVLVRIRSSDRLQLTSRKPLAIDMQSLGFPVESFADEFGLTLSREAEVTLDLELPYTIA
jgi:aerobic-type carbon monoxide dehydrogenase small subunit (CoxS/CutS family)